METSFEYFFAIVVLVTTIALLKTMFGSWGKVGIYLALGGILLSLAVYEVISGLLVFIINCFISWTLMGGWSLTKLAWDWRKK